MKTVVFICTGNAGRSVMAQALFSRRAGNTVHVLSAGVEPWQNVHPMAVKLMTERGIDVSAHRPRHVEQIVDEDIDVAVTIGDRAERETSELRTGTRRIHWPIDDPAEADGTPDSERVFRTTCQRIEAHLDALHTLVEAMPRRRAASWSPGVSTALCRPNRFMPARDVPLLVRAGFRHLELCCYKEDRDFPWEDKAAVRELKRVADSEGLSVASVHPPDRANPGCPHAAERQVQVDVLLRSLDLAVELGAESLSIHVGFGLAAGTERTAWLAAQEEMLDRLEAAAVAAPACFCLETLPGRPSDMSNADVIKLVRERPAAAVGIVLDTGHPHIAGDLHGLIEKSGRRLRNLHLHDNDGRRDQHRLPGEGTIAWTPFMQALRRNGYEGPLMLEVESETGDFEADLARCRSVVDDLSARAPSGD